MPEDFNPYHKWLGIPPEEQPPHHYRLLGIKLYESDPDVIDTAADRQMLLLRTFQSGPHGELSQQLLNEISAAKLVLLNPEKKATYDKKLKASLAKRDAASGRSGPIAAAPAKRAARPKPVAQPAQPVAPAGPAIRADDSASPVARMKRRTPAWQHPAILGGGVGALLLVGVAVALMGSGNGGPDPDHDKLVKKKDDSRPEKELPPSKKEDSPPKEIVPIQPIDPLPKETPKKNPNEEGGPTVGPDPKPPVETIDTPGEENPPVALPAEPERLAVPVQQEREEALALIKDVFKAELDEATTPETRSALAQTMLDQGRQSRDDPVGRFVLYEQARELAIFAGNAAIALAVVDEMATVYNVDGREVLMETLDEVNDRLRSDEARRKFAEVGMQVVERWINEQHFEGASRLVRMAFSAARKGDADELADQIAERRQELDRLVVAYAAYQEAAKTLEEKPDDPDANQTVGEYYCYVLADWEQGLPMLAKGNHAALKELAAQDLAAPKEAEKQIALGDGWWQQAQRARGKTKEQLLYQAVYWYGQALPNVDSALIKSKLEKRIVDAGLPPTQPVYLDDLPVARGSDARLGTHGKNHSATQMIRFERQTPAHALAIHANGTRAIPVIFQIDGQYGWFQSTVGLQDGRSTPGKLTFRVLGDGKELWKSRVHQTHAPEDLKISVRGVNELRLELICEGSSSNGWCAWVNPQLFPLRGSRGGTPGNTPSAAPPSRRHPVLGYELKPAPPNARLTFDGHWYAIDFDRVTWDEAQRRCQEMGGYLVCIETAEEERFLQDLKRENSAFWMGGGLNPNGSFSWINGQPFKYTNWRENQPNPQNGAANRLNRYGGGWSLQRPAGTMHFICEWELPPSATTSANKPSKFGPAYRIKHTDWQPVCWVNERWVVVPQDRMQSSVVSGALQVANTTGIFHFAKVQFRKELLSGDFRITGQVMGQCRSLALSDAEGRERTVYHFFNPPLTDDRWHEFTFQRNAGTITATWDGRPIDIMSPKASHDLAGYFNFGVNANK